MNRVLLLSLLLAFGSLAAQKSKSIVKVGVIDIQRVIDKVASDRALKGMLEERKNESLRRAEDLAKQINALKELLAKEGPKLEADRVQRIRQDVAAKEEELKAYLTEQSTLLQQKEEAISYRVLQNIYDFVKETAIRGGYSLILEKGSAVIWVENDLDLTEEVLKAIEKERELQKTQGTGR